MDNTSTIARNARIHAGRLDNGMSYYVLHNAKPANRIELRLVVAAGSMNEQDHERGLAHFVEHMGFKGTRSYEQYQLVRFLESLGISYGPELNASTHLHETCFNLRVNGDEDLGHLSTGLHILEEWAYYMTISEADVDSERSIIHAEWKSKQGAGQRMLEVYWRRVFHNTMYAERMPIGLPEVFMNCEASLLKEFYKKWYTPDRISVVVVGDFAGKEERVVSMIRDIFTSPTTSIDSPPHTTIPSQVHRNLPTHQEDVIVALNDPELTNASITFESMFRFDPQPTRAHMKQDVICRLLTTLFDRRFHAISKGEFQQTPLGSGEAGVATPPFLSAGISIRPVVRNLMCLGVTVQFSKDQTALERALIAVLQEMRRACEFGFTVSEVKGAQLRWLEYFEDLRDNHANTPSSAYTSDIVQHILHNQQTILAEPREEASIALELLEEITSEDISGWIHKLDFHLPSAKSSVYHTNSNTTAFRVISSQFPGNDFTDAMLESAVEAARQAIYSIPFLPWPDVGPLGTLLESSSVDARLHPGTIVEHVHHPVTDTGEFVLSNGIHVCCKWMPDSAHGQISMQGFALGGSTELTEEEEAMMSCLDDICTRSGVGGIDGRNYSEIQSRYKTRINTQRHHHHRGIGGSCPTKRFELLLQMLHLKFTAQNFDPVAFSLCIQQQRAAVDFRDNAPEFNFMERARVLTVGDVPITRVVTAEVFDRLSLEMAKDLYIRAFMRDPTEFTFVFVGDLPDVSVVESLLVSYVGSLQPINVDLKPWVSLERLPFSPLGAIFPESTVVEHMDLRVADKSSVLMAYRAALPIDDDDLDVRDTAIVNLCCSIAQARLLDVLRIRYGHVYSVTVGLGRNSLSDFGIISISLHCDVDKADEICDIIVNELIKLQTMGPTIEELTAAVEIMANSRTLALENRSYWLFWVLDALKALKYIEMLHGKRPRTTLDHHCAARSIQSREMLTTISAQHISDGFLKYFDINRRVQLILGPRSNMHGRDEQTVNS